MDRLQSVPHVGQGPAHNDGHGIFDIGLFHLWNQRGYFDLLVRVADLLRIVLGFFAHEFTSSLLEAHFFLLSQPPAAPAREPIRAARAQNIANPAS